MGYCPFSALGRDLEMGVAISRGWCAQARRAAEQVRARQRRDARDSAARVCDLVLFGPQVATSILVSRHSWGWDQVGPWLRHDFSCHGRGSRGVS